MQVWVRFLSGGRRGETVPLQVAMGGSITIGRADENMIVLPAHIDVAASSRHAELQNQNNTLVLVDRGSTNGTWVYGNRVQTVPLASGIRVTFGRGGPEAEVFFQPDAGVPAPPAAPMPAQVARPPAQVTRPGGVVAPQVYAAPAAPAPAAYAQTMNRPAVNAAGAPQQWGAPPPPQYQQPAQQQASVDPGCEICGAHDAPSFVCFTCARCVCESHRDRPTGGCSDCANGGPQQQAAPQAYPQQAYAQQPQYAQPQQQYAPQPGYGAPAGYPPQGGGGGMEGCEICGAQDSPSFVCYGCTRCVCESHRERTTGMCQQCAGAATGGAAQRTGRV